MTNPPHTKKHGNPPYRVVVVHGGPGAAGEMAPVARHIATRLGVLEPHQTALSLEAQVSELRDVIVNQGDPPLFLVGFSWGAWLSFLVAAKHPELVKKLILIGSGPFREEYAGGIFQTRLDRMEEDEKMEALALSRFIFEGSAEGDRLVFDRVASLFTKADAYEPMPDDPDLSPQLDLRPDIFQAVWKQAAEWRRSGRLLAQGKLIRCPVVAIHGDFDPHPAEGVRAPLAAVLNDFHFELLEHCGHRPWIERHARDKFYQVLMKELENG